MTVSSLKPNPVVALHESATVFEASSYMAAKRQDAVLITDSEGHLTGIVTDKDMTYRLVAESLDPKSTPVSYIMTQNPVSVGSSEGATEALNKMVNGHFRHLPVLEDSVNNDEQEGGVVGVLDITKCLIDALAKLERVNASNEKLNQAIIEVENEFQTSKQSLYADFLSSQLGMMDLGSLIEAGGVPPIVSLNSNVLQAAMVMLQHRETAVLVLDTKDITPHVYSGQIAGIFTTKDVVLRVLAANLDPRVTPVMRVMTPHPDTANMDTTILEALRKMHAGRYLHLPVVCSDSGMLEGMVDVLKLTYSTLDQLNNLTSDSGGPVWNKFWESAAMSEVSGHSYRSRNSRRKSRRNNPQTPSEDGGSVIPDDSASMFQPRKALTDDEDSQQYSGMVGIPNNQVQLHHNQVAASVHSNSTPTLLEKIQGGELFLYKFKYREVVYRFISSSVKFQEVM
ncbi:hypothetical protein HK099_007264 [Clydaea vesicula]|uniref:CBS domain-containing protein n=1 Tax=Clydaea vesicula TaxID=447962 RepID=A0AAD5TYW8_9FUNG|nr:hypothetical protein HK099_007264 [Clydaea vesicula]